MSRSKIEIFVCAALLMAIFGLSLSLRIAVPWNYVFSGQWVKFTDNDAYFFLRLLDNLSHHFPLLGSYDPYYSSATSLDLGGQRLFFVYLMAFFARLFGGPAPSQQVVDMVAAYSPAVLGALLVFPVFIIGKAIFNKWAGLVSSLFIALIPGEFLTRTLLGNTDVHVMEIFFSTMFIAFTVLAARSGADTGLYPFTSSTARRLLRPIAYSLAAGLCMGIYVLSWPGALFFVLISFVWLVIQMLINHVRGIACGPPGLFSAVSYFAALLLALTLTQGTMVWISLGVAIAAALVLPLISWYAKRRNLRTGYYPIAVVVLAGLGCLFLFTVRPQFLRFMVDGIMSFYQWYPGSTIAESQPLLLNNGTFTLSPLWGNYTAGSVLALIGLCILSYRAVKEGQAGITLLVVWSILTLLAALALRRFAYYFAVNVALLSGYTGWLILQACGFREQAAETAIPVSTGNTRRKAKGKQAAAKKSGTRAGVNPALVTLGIVAVAFLAIYPNTGPLPGGDRPFFDVATKGLYTPSNAWYETLNWMRNNTPEPFGDSEYYYKYYQGQPVNSSRSDSKAGYSVFCWWDYGYWVTRVAHRAPFTNPGTAQVYEQYVYMAQDGQAAADIGTRYSMRYLLVNDYLVNWNSGFPIVAADAQNPSSKYYEIYYRTQNGKLSPTLLYYPEYYKTVAVRLYCFDGKQYTPTETAVISWESRTGTDGRPYKEITGLKTFRLYNEAVDFIAAQKEGNWRIVGKDPNVSAVPLQESTGYRLAYGSSQKSRIGTADISEVKVFEYTKP